MKKIKTKELQKIVFIIILLVICQTISYYGHFIYKSEIAYTHFFYIPIVLATIWWNFKGLVIPALMSAIILLTHSFSGMEWQFTASFFRISMFFLVGTLTSIISHKRLVIVKKLDTNNKNLENEILKRKEKEKELKKHKGNLEELVKERTEELEASNEELKSNIGKLAEANKELERLNNLFIGREFRIKELRDKVEELEGKLSNN